MFGHLAVKTFITKIINFQMNLTSVSEKKKKSKLLFKPFWCDATGSEMLATDSAEKKMLKLVNQIDLCFVAISSQSNHGLVSLNPTSATN